MGIDTKGILLGTIDPIKVVNVINHQYGSECKVRVVSEGFYQITFNDKSTNTIRVLCLFNGDGFKCDNRDIFDGEKTMFSLGMHGDSVAIGRMLVTEFGGFLNESDANDNWEYIEGENVVQISDVDYLKIDLLSILGSDQISAVNNIFASPEKITKLRDTLELYLSGLEHNRPTILTR